MSACFPPYGSARQQDAHEFLGDLLNKLQEELFPYARRHAARTLALQAQQEKEKEAAAAATAVAAAATVATAAAAKPSAAGGKKGAAGGGGKAQQQEQQGAGQTSIRTFFTRKPSIDPALVSSSSSSSSSSAATATAGEQAVVLDETVSEAEAAVLELVLPVTRHFHSEVRCDGHALRMGVVCLWPSDACAI